MKKLFFALALLLGTNFAQAQEGKLWACGMEFKGVAQGIQILVGDFKLKSTGKLTCDDGNGTTEVIPVRVTMGAAPFAPRIAFGAFEVYGASAQIQLANRNPRDLMGEYAVLQAQAAVVGGVGLVTGIHASDNDIAVQLSLQFLKGLGVNFGFTTLKIELDETVVQ